MKSTAKNVIVFGETGAGKSSVINMLADKEYDALARVGATAAGVTFEATCYQRRIDGKPYNIFDTVGLGEASGGTIEAADAIKALYRLMRNLRGGIHLLVFVARGPRITAAAQRNYEMFYKIFCDEKVPIVLFLTFMEDVVAEGQEAWLEENVPLIDNMGMSFDGYACITASPGWHNARQNQYEESVKLVTWEIKGRCRRLSWIPSGGTIPWLKKVVVKMYNRFASFFNLTRMVINNTLYEALKTFHEFASDTEARAAANDIAMEADEEERKKRRSSGKKSPGSKIFDSHK